MNVPFGKYRGKSVEQLVLKEPDYVVWVFQQRNATGAMVSLQAGVRRLIQAFDAKPFVATCSHQGCNNRATRATVYGQNLSRMWRCQSCDPYTAGAAPDNIQIVVTYSNAVNHVATYCNNRKQDMQVLIRALASAKGLPFPARQDQLVAFFR